MVKLYKNSWVKRAKRVKDYLRWTKFHINERKNNSKKRYLYNFANEKGRKQFAMAYAQRILMSNQSKTIKPTYYEKNFTLRSSSCFFREHVG